MATKDTKAQHTPGPWSYDEKIIDGRERGYIRCSRSHKGAEKAIAVARVSESGLPVQESRENARLIAAAPDLLGMAKRAEEGAQEALDALYATFKEGKEPVWWEDVQPILVQIRDEARAAIEKAMGANHA